jgi:uncharacterized protein (DUF427 family)
MVFETGLPTSYYLERTSIDFEHLTPSDTVTECASKGTTSGQLLPIAGLIAFYDERVDLFLDGRRLERPEQGPGAGVRR